MPQKVAKEIPLSEFTLRRYEKPSERDLRGLVKRLCLSIGLLQPGDSRDSIVDVFEIFLTAAQPLAIEDAITYVRNKRKSLGLDLGVAESNLRRQIRRLKEQGWIAKYQGKYALAEHMNVASLFLERIKPYHLEPAMERIAEYCKAIDALRS